MVWSDEHLRFVFFSSSSTGKVKKKKTSSLHGSSLPVWSDSPPTIWLPYWLPAESEPSSGSRCRWLLPRLPPPSPAPSSARREKTVVKTSAGTETKGLKKVVASCENMSYCRTNLHKCHFNTFNTLEQEKKQSTKKETHGLIQARGWYNKTSRVTKSPTPTITAACQASLPPTCFTPSFIPFLSLCLFGS